MMSTDALIALVVYMALVLTASLYGLAISGHFPRKQASDIGSIVLFGSIAVVIICLIAGIGAAARLMPWYAAIIGGGLVVLAAPLVLQCFPDRFVDSNAALTAFAGAVLGLAIPLIVLAFHS
jgi:hypothetical protein